MTCTSGGVKSIRLDERKSYTFDDIVNYAVNELLTEENKGFFDNTLKRVGNF